MPNARKVAVDALLKVEKDKAYSNLTLNETLKQANLSDLDKSFATALFYGTLDRKITLDYFLDSLTKTPFSKTEPFTKTVLRTALYQILYMDKIPNSAAVNEAVKIMKNSKKRAQSGFVNAVLRSALRQELILPQDLSVKYSCPEWITNELVKDYGKTDAEKILADTFSSPSTYLRVNNIKISAEKLSEKIGVKNEICENGSAVKLLGGITFEQNECYKKGYFHIQDLSSQRAVKMLELKSGERVLDTCAAPGGKSFTMAEIMENTGEIISCDLYKTRTELIEKSAKRLGLTCIKTFTADACKFDEKLGLFDAVLCDVPCSGFGVIRRKPDIKYKSEQLDFKKLEETQQTVLQNAVRYLKNGGRILYSTCTLRKSENEAQVEKFIKNNPDFEIVQMHTFLPFADFTDGFFAALIKRKDM